MNALPVVAPAGAFAATALLGAILCKIAPRLQLVAHPNRRSSHTQPTPTSGGLAFVAVIVGWLLFTSEDFGPATVLALAGLAIAALGLLDDVRHVRRDLRLACHGGLAAGCVAGLFEPSFLLGIFLALGLMWWLNLYNFMDGIDGIAASQAAAYALGTLLIGDLSHSASFVYVLLAAALGFLVVNWAPAKIFMGDVGSGFLGLTTGVLALWLAYGGELPFVASAILLLGFWLDASYTLGVRIVTRQAFADAHRSHLYQILARRLGHGRATGLFCLHWALWLLPLAALAVSFPTWQVACLAVAGAPLAVACVAFGAGKPDAD